MTTGRAPLRCPVPFVVTVHDLTVIDRPDLYPARERWLTAIWLRRSIRAAAGIACVSEATARDLARAFPGLTAPVEVIHEAVAEAFQRPPTAAGVARLVADRALGPRIWLHVGEMSWRKNLPRLIDAFAIARQAVGGPPPVLVLAGRPGPASGAVARGIAESGLQDAVRRLDWVPEDDLPALYAAAELVVCASEHEGFGLPALEAMSCGVPLVSSRRGGLAEVVGDAALPADPGNVAALAGAMIALGSDLMLRQRLAAAGRQRAERFDGERMIRRTEDLCARLALPRRTPRATMGGRSPWTAARPGSHR